ncbi:MAG: hypothetical protein CME56_06395 [Halieaceae bacterium]|nr:hypothetical protein [Halieaceae bacterium]
MYLPVIEPIDRLCTEALESARSGDISRARQLIDRVRTMRSRLARSVHNHRWESIENWIQSCGLDDEDLLRYRGQASALNKKLDIIGEWISGSVSTFSLAELMASSEGLGLYVDAVLPAAWDFSQDIAILVGEHAAVLDEELRNRGQQKFIYLLANNSDEKSITLPLAASDAEIDSVEFTSGSSPNAEMFSHLLGEEIPLIVVFGLDPMGEPEAVIQEDYERIRKSLSAVFLGKRSIKEWPEIFTDQWLGRMHDLPEFGSASELRPKFKGQDVLIASPGPSLTDSLDDLKQRRAEFLVIAPIRSLKALLEADVVPDYAFHVDATDFSSIIPEHPSLSDISMICGDYVHSSIFDGGFGDIYVAPDPSMVGNDLSTALHGGDPPLLQGGCVATCAVAMSAQYGAASITLIGQDLSISKGKYVQQTKGAKLGISKNKEAERENAVLTCQGINGERLQTQDDYLWFIGEMENAAAYYASKVEFFNCTTHGAFLKGWTHEPLLDRRLELPATSSAESPANDTVVSESPSQSHRYSEVAQAIGLERAQVDEAAIICDRLVKELHRLMDAGENDVTQVDELEERLKKMLEEKGSILHFYTSRFTMALSAAMKSVTNLKENLSISAEYYHHVGADARKLSASMDSALKSLTSVEGC